MNKIKLILILTIISINSFATENPMIKIAIMQTISHPALDNTYRGIIDTLQQNGYVNGKNVEIIFANAQGDSILSNQIAKKLIAKGPDLLITIATLATQSATNATKNTNIPVVFSSVTDPSPIIKNHSNITGVSNFISLEPQLNLFKEILPNIENLGFIYNPGEINSIKMLETLKIKAKLYNINIIPAIANKTTEISTATTKLISKKVDAIFISNDNTALAAFSVITKISNKTKIPVFVSDIDMLEKGALAALGPNQYNIGTQTAEMAISILKGNNIKNIKITYPDKIDLLINKKIAEDLGINIPQIILDRIN